MIASAAEMAKSALLELMDLPEEILLMVMRLLDYESLLSAIFVSKRFHALAQPFIYESATILHGSKAYNLSRSLAKDVRRTRWMRSFLVSTKFGQETALMKLSPSICKMVNLEELRLETPDCNQKKATDRLLWIRLQDNYESMFKLSSVLVPCKSDRLLPNLRTCVLHFVDTHTELYSLSRYSSIFLHPTLQSLTVSCMSTGRPEAVFPDIEDISCFVGSTALEYLHLEECDFDTPTLEILLSFPRALKSLKISEGTRYDGNFRAGSSRAHGNVQPRAFAKALVNTCSDSLETLSLALGYIHREGQNVNQISQSLKLDGLKHLKHLEVHHLTLNLIYDRPNCDHNTWKRLPATLETLKIFEIQLLPSRHQAGRTHLLLQPCLIREKQLHGVPNLKKIIYSFEHYETTNDEEDLNLNEILLGFARNQPPPAGNANTHTNPILTLLQHAVGAANAPQQQQPIPAPVPIPAPPNFITTGVNQNLDAPAQNIHPPRFRWRSGPLHERRQSRPEMSRCDIAKLTLLKSIHEHSLSHHIETNTRLQIDIVTLPRGFIPPYLFPEDKPRIQEAWFDSLNPMTPLQFMEAARSKRHATMYDSARRVRRTGEEIGNHDEYSNERVRSRRRFMRRLRNGEIDDSTFVPNHDDDEDDEENESEDDPDYVDDDTETDEDSMDDDDEDDEIINALVGQALSSVLGESIVGNEGEDEDGETDTETESEADDTGSFYVDASVGVGYDIHVDTPMSGMGHDEDEEEGEEDDDMIGDEDEMLFFSAASSRRPT